MCGDHDLAIATLAAEEMPGYIPALAALLHACVHAGASISFVLPFRQDDAAGFWTARVLPAMRAGGQLLLVAREGGCLVGTVQLGTDTPPNQPHRAEVSKLLVHPERRRRGIARALMAALEREARARGRSLITLDTRTGDAAEPLYTALGYRTVGTIPGYCVDPFDPACLESTTIMYKVL
ncbi:MAG TPA: GNAT family N-acetyltransferase [Pseudohaliea sp.]|nr:GNAT family N-acetyltransferase [Pseudohaliea sp.]